MKSSALRIPRFIVESLLVLPLGCVVALAWANTAPESYYRASHALEFWVNEVGIVFFLGLMAKEVREAMLPGGDLHPWRRAGLAVAAAVGGAVVPALIYLWYLDSVASEPMLMQAWVVTFAVDVAASYLVAGFVFGKHPAVPFVLLLALASDAMGLIIIAAEDAAATSLPGGLALVAAAVALAIAMRAWRVASFWPYVLGAGAVSWAGMHYAGMHPALALVPIVPFMPHSARDEGFFVPPPPHCRDSLACFERAFTLPVQGVLFLFGLVNGGVPLHGLEAGIAAVPIAVIVGRPIGIVLATEAGVAAGLYRLPRVGWKELIVAASAASIGLTFALFFATSALPTGSLLAQTKGAALLTSAGAIVVLLLAWLLGVGRFERVVHHPQAAHGDARS
jgi:NhaA family Na+:H+ antiporter